MSANILAAIGAALQQGSQTYGQLTEQERERKRIERQLALQEAEFRAAESQRKFQNDAAGREEAAKLEDREAVKIARAIENANEDFEFDEDFYKRADKHEFEGRLQIKRPATSATQGARPGINFPTSLDPNAPVMTSDNRQLSRLDATPATYGRRFTPEEQAKNEQARTIAELMKSIRPTAAPDKSVAPTPPTVGPNAHPSRSQLLGATPQAPTAKPKPKTEAALTPDQVKRMAISMIPGMSATEVLGAPQKPGLFEGDSPFRGPTALTELVSAGKISQGEAAQVQAMVNYDAPPPSPRQLQDPKYQQMLELAYTVDPTFSPALYSTRQALRRDYYSGTTSKTIRSLNQALGHIKDLEEAGENLNNYSVSAANWVKNEFNSEVMDNPAVTDWELAADAVASEASKFFKGSAGTNQEIAEWRSQMTANMGPERQRAAIVKLMKLMKHGADALDAVWVAGMGKPRETGFLSKESIENLESHGVPVDNVDPTSRLRPWTDTSTGKTEGKPEDAPADAGGGLLDKGMTVVGDTSAPPTPTGKIPMTVVQVNAYAKSKGTDRKTGKPRMLPAQALKELQDRGYELVNSAGQPQR
jgi:hypothetical protein